MPACRSLVLFLILIGLSVPRAAGSLSDFAAQGEYLGAWIPDNGPVAALGAQVVASDGGNFRAVFYPGGLPGAGWAGTDRSEADLATTPDGIAFTDPAHHGILAGDSLVGSAAGGRFALAKVGRRSPSLGLPPPAGAEVLFDGTSVEAWTHALRDTLGNLAPLEREAVTRKRWSDFSLHLEFRLPFLPSAAGQSRANSGLRFLDGKFLYAEIQLLDSFGALPGTEECGGIELQYAPLVMAAFPPMSWQTLDIHLTTPAPGDSVPTVGEAILTVWQNGILIHPGRAIGKMGAEVNLALQSLDAPGGFRNIWILNGNDGYAFFPGSALREGARKPGAVRLPRLQAGKGRAGTGFSVRVAAPDGPRRIDGARLP